MKVKYTAIESKINDLIENRNFRTLFNFGKFVRDLELTDNIEYREGKQKRYPWYLRFFARIQNRIALEFVLRKHARALKLLEED